MQLAPVMGFGTFRHRRFFAATCVVAPGCPCIATCVAMPSWPTPRLASWRRFPGAAARSRAALLPCEVLLPAGSGDRVARWIAPAACSTAGMRHRCARQVARCQASHRARRTPLPLPSRASSGSSWRRLRVARLEPYGHLKALLHRRSRTTASTSLSRNGRYSLGLAGAPFPRATPACAGPSGRECTSRRQRTFEMNGSRSELPVSQLPADRKASGVPRVQDGWRRVFVVQNGKTISHFEMQIL